MVQLKFWLCRGLAAAIFLGLLGACAGHTPVAPPTLSNHPSCIMANKFADTADGQSKRSDLLESRLQRGQAMRQVNYVWLDFGTFSKKVVGKSVHLGLIKQEDMRKLEGDPSSYAPNDGDSEEDVTRKAKERSLRERYIAQFDADYLEYVTRANRLGGYTFSDPVDGTTYVDWNRLTREVVRQGCLQVPDPHYASVMVRRVIAEVDAEQAIIDAEIAAETEAQQLAAEEAELQRLRREVEKRGLLQELNGPVASPGHHVEEFIRDYFHDIPIMVEIARCESTFRNIQSEIIEADGIPEESYGFFQIHKPTWHATALAMGLGDYQTNPMHNLIMARHIYKVDGPEAWSCY